MELTEQELYQDFGLEPPAAGQDPAGQGSDTGVNGQEVAGPAQHTDSGENAQEPAGPADTSGQDAGAPGDRAQVRQGEPGGERRGEETEQDPPGGQEPPPGQDGKPVQSAEERHRQAGLRRQAEEQARAQAQQAALDEAYRAAFAGRLNPYTGRPILNQADFQEYQRAQEAERGKRQMEQLQKAGIDPAALQSVVEQLPVVRQARQVLDEAQQAKTAAEAERARTWFGEQLRGIAALGLDPDVGSLEDLAGKYPDKYPEMMDRVRKGATLVEAYQTVNFEAILAKRTAAAKQAALNSTAGKEHLQPTAPAGGQGGSVEVPADVRQMYRELNPGLSDADIRREYAEFIKLMK